MRSTQTIFKLVLEPELHAKLKICAFNSHRTLGDEITSRLEESLALGLKGDGQAVQTPPTDDKGAGEADLLGKISRAELVQIISAVDKLKGLLGDTTEAATAKSKPPTKRK